VREPKPYWRDVPKELLTQIIKLVESPIIGASRVFGGYGPSATFRIVLEDGRSIFAKGAGKGSISGNWQTLPHEEWMYRNITGIKPFSPRYLGAVTVEGWHLLLLEDLVGSINVPPWTEKLALQAVKDIATFHVSCIHEGLKVKEIEGNGIVDNWLTIKDSPYERNCFLQLFIDSRLEAEAWLDQTLDAFIALEADVLHHNQPWGLIHKDIRSDNLCFRDGKLILFDWALACRGPLLFDFGFFLPSLEGEGGPVGEKLLFEYQKEMACSGIKFPAFSAQSVAAATAGFFASRAGKPGIAALPTLRQVQRLQLGPALRLACSVLNLPKPPSLNFNAYK